MSVSLVDVRIKGVKTFENQEFYVDFRNDKRVSTHEVYDKVVSRMAGTNYRNHVIAMAGINASGKTTALKLIDFVLKVFISGEALNSSGALFDIFLDNVVVNAHFTYEKKLFRHTAMIFKNFDTVPAQLLFSDEICVIKNMKPNETKATFFTFDEDSDIIVRSQLDEELRRFIKLDDSILPSLVRGGQSPKEPYVFSRVDLTNLNYLNAITTYSPEILAYLDSSIEELSLVEEESSKSKSQPKCKLKFHGEESVVVRAIDLENYLSSGTIRGLAMFTEIMVILSVGGYYIVDEIENHFNKTIVEGIISFFQSDVNQNGATLLFSTHYSEILDRVARKESIKVLRKNEDGIKINSLTDLARAQGKDRTDIKTSDLILSGIFDTAPSYEQYWTVKKQIRAAVDDGFEKRRG